MAIRLLFLSFFAVLAVAKVPRIHLLREGGCLLLNGEMTCWGDPLLAQLRPGVNRAKPLPTLTIQGGLAKLPNVDVFSGSELNLCFKLPGEKPHCALNGQQLLQSTAVDSFKISGNDGVCTLGTDGVYCYLQYNQRLDIREDKIHSYSPYAGWNCTVFGDEKKIRCDTMNGNLTPYPFTDLVGIEFVMLGGPVRGAATACIIWGEDRKLICHRLDDREVPFPRLQNVHEIVRISDTGFCAIHGTRREVECFHADAAQIPNECPNSKTFNPLIGKMAIEKVVALSAVPGADRFQQVCALVENDPVPYCWMYGCGDAARFKSVGWSEKELPDWHPRYGQSGFGHFQGEYVPGAPVITPLKPKPPATDASPTPSTPTSDFKDL